MKYRRDWKSRFVYDESSPSCLRWARNVYAGDSISPYILFAKGDVVGSVSSEGYWKTSEYEGDYKSTAYSLHRVIWEMHNGELRDEDLLDHIDGDRLNNKIENLRIVSRALNARNAKKYSNNTSGQTGVYHDKKTFPSDGVDRYYFKASWQELDGRQKTKSFSICRLGVMVAYREACRYRTSMIEKLNSQGAGYTERHGTTLRRTNNERSN